MKRIELLGAALVAALPSLATAHDLWLWPVPLQVTPGTTVEVALRLGEQGKVEAAQFDPARIERLFVASKGASRDIAVAGPVAAIAVETTGSGTHSIAYVSQPAVSDLPSAKFDSYLEEEHLDAVIAARRARPDKKADVREHYSRSLKALVSTDDDALTDCPLGLPFELSLEKADAGRVTVRAWFEDRPLAGVWIDLADARSQILEEQRTDSEGMVTFGTPRGAAVVRATHMIPSTEPGVDWRSWWATTIFLLADNTRVAPCR